MDHIGERDKVTKEVHAGFFFCARISFWLFLCLVLLAERNAEKEACTKEIEEKVAEKLL